MKQRNPEDRKMSEVSEHGYQKARPDKYNDLEKTGNIYGEIPEHPKDSSNNGRTPVNPIAQNPMEFRVSNYIPLKGKDTKTHIEQA